MKKVTEHYGYERYYAGPELNYIYGIHRLEDGERVTANPVAYRQTWYQARKECEYLEKLNEPKFKKGEER